MKKNIFQVLKMATYYSFLGIILQAMIMNVLLASSPAEGQNLHYLKIKVNVVNVSLEQAFHALEQNSIFTFSYVKNELPSDARVTLNAEDESFQQILESLSTEYNLTFFRVNDIIVVKKAKEVEKIIEEGRGSLRGTIVDSLTNEAMIGVNVIVLGSSLGAATDLEGQYRITGIPTGTHRIKVSYIGYKSKEFEVRIENNRTLLLDANLQYDILQGSEVLITAQMRGQAAAINRQITSDVAINVVSSDRIRELPDANAAEAIGRLPGISLIRSGGEASKVVVRGLEPKFNAITLNGVRIPSSDGGDRSVDLTMIASEALDGIEVFKALTPDMDADAVGGVVNLKIKKAPQERNIRFKLDGGVSQLKNDWGNYKINGDYSDRFFNSAIGVVAVASYERINRSSERYTADYELEGNEVLSFEGRSVSLSNSVLIRNRLTGSMTLDYTFENGTIWLTNFYSSTPTNPYSVNKGFPGYAASSINYGVSESENAQTGISNAINGELHILGADIDWVLSRYNVKTNKDFGVSMSYTQGVAFDQSILDRKDVNTYVPAAKIDINEIYLASTTFSQGHTSQTDYAAQLNLKVPLRFGDQFNGFLKMGGKYISTERDNFNYEIKEINYQTVVGPYIQNAEKLWPYPLIKLTNGRISVKNFIKSETDFETILKGDGDYNLWPVFDRDIMREWVNTLKSGYREDRAAGKRNYDLSETVTSAYVMTQLNFGRVLTIMPGVRYEHSDNKYNAFFSTLYEIYGQSGQIRDTSSARKLGYWFPHLHMKFKPLEWFDVKLSANKTLARPNYNMISPFTDFNTTNTSLSTGNTNLKETKVWNYNVTFSFYDNLFGLFAVSGFYKDLRDIFYGQSTRIWRPEDIEKYNIPGKEGGYSLNSYGNSDRAIVKGFELELQTQLALIPGMQDFLKGFVFNANYSRIWSETEFPIGYDFNTTLIPGTRPPKFEYDLTNYYRRGPMPGQANQIANFSLGYDIGGLSARLSVLYQGASLNSIATAAPEEDGWNNSFWRWDASVKYRLNQMISFNVNLVNISNQPDRAYMGLPEYLTNKFYYGMTGSAGIEIRY